MPEIYSQGPNKRAGEIFVKFNKLKDGGGGGGDGGGGGGGWRVRISKSPLTSVMNEKININV